MVRYKNLYKEIFEIPQWLRNIKIKKNFGKFTDRIPQLIFDGGWHFSFLKNSKNISRKIRSYAHQEYNKEEFFDIKTIDDKISQSKDILGRNFNYKKIRLDNTYPEFILNNREVFKKWIL